MIGFFLLLLLCCDLFDRLYCCVMFIRLCVGCAVLFACGAGRWVGGLLWFGFVIRSIVVCAWLVFVYCYWLVRIVVFGVLFYYLMLFGLFGYRFAVILMLYCLDASGGCCFVCLLGRSWFVVLMVVYSCGLCCS